ncbi:kinesin KIN-7O [Olea europaea subsp. europaea]|uniref:Kinesin KIN-7O n=1 Tax=Olea europaea subsp. europaea TaxID=158383 RepID=A0A8S0R000_OLEEU|nr:kinesin KIN-7O [Olea europaea subsp. europaea]
MRPPRPRTGPAVMPMRLGAALLEYQDNLTVCPCLYFEGLHSEHLEEEILNLWNTLLKSEFEREKMALELEEEKKAQAEREKRLQEQAKKIENLS